MEGANDRAGPVCSLLPTTDSNGIAWIAILQLMTELNMRLRFDPDGSGTVARFLGIVGEYDEIGRVISAPGMPWDAAAADSRITARRRVLAAEPILSRLSRPRGVG